MATEWKGLPPEADSLVLQDYFSDGTDKRPRYYQATAVNDAVESVAKGQDRLLLVMATGTGKTAFQIIWRLWKSGRKKRILFLGARASLCQFIPAGSAAPEVVKYNSKRNLYTGLCQ